MLLQKRPFSFHMLFSSRCYVHEDVRRCTVVSYLLLLSALGFPGQCPSLGASCSIPCHVKVLLFNLRALLSGQVKVTVMAWVRGAGAGPGQQPPFLRNKIAQVLACIVQVRRHLAPQLCSALLMRFKEVWQRMPSVTLLICSMCCSQRMRYAKGRAKSLLCFRNACVVAVHLLLIPRNIGHFVRPVLSVSACPNCCNRAHSLSKWCPCLWPRLLQVL